MASTKQLELALSLEKMNQNKEQHEHGCAKPYAD
jgi:hypothetical protein